MRVVFFGTGEFGIPTLKALLGSKHIFLAAVTRPDVRKGRGWNVLPTPVKEVVEKVSPGTKVFQPVNLSEEVFVADLKNLDADIFVVVDYGRILPDKILSAPRKYCINLHPSLLPLYRGPAPVSRAILSGDSVTGNTVMRINERMDSGDIILQDKVDIGEHDTSGVLEDKLSLRGASLILKAIDLIDSDNVNFIEQDEARATYAAKLEKAEGKINWDLPACDIALKVRGLQPWPGAFTFLGGKVLKILQASVCEVPEGNYTVGQVLKTGSKLIVNTGQGALRIGRVQLEGKKAMSSDEFLSGHQTLWGAVLG